MDKLLTEKDSLDHIYSTYSLASSFFAVENIESTGREELSSVQPCPKKRRILSWIQLATRLKPEQFELNDKSDCGGTYEIQ